MNRSLSKLGFMALLFVLLAYGLDRDSPAASQTEDTGVIDIGKERQKRIYELEAKLKLDPDKKAQKQVVILEWLIELYADAGRNQDVLASYDKILSIFPYDVRILNSYAEFLIERLNRTERAQELLHDAIAYGKKYSVSDKLLGNTYFLLGKMCFIEKDHAEACEHLEHARFLLGEETPEAAIRLLAVNYHLAGKHDEASDVLLELIGRTKGSIQQDIDLLRRISSQTARFQGMEISDIIAGAVRRETERQREIHEARGAEVISIAVNDTVTLEGSLYRGEGVGAVLFIPDIGSTRLAWDVFAQMASVEGISALSIDLRDHGGSRSETIRHPIEAAEPYLSLLANDIAFVLEHLKTILNAEEHELVVVSEGGICAAIEQAFYRCNMTPAAMYLSPYFDAGSRELRNAVAFRKDRPLMIMYSTEDLLASRSVAYFTGIKPLSLLTTVRLENAGHGKEALSTEPKVLARYDQWLRDQLKGSQD